MAGVQMRDTLSAPGLLREVRKCFDRIPDTVRGRRRKLTSYLMSGLAVSQVHCRHCCEKRHRDGWVTYYHPPLKAVRLTAWPRTARNLSRSATH